MKSLIPFGARSSSTRGISVTRLFEGLTGVARLSSLRTFAISSWSIANDIQQHFRLYQLLFIDVDQQTKAVIEEN